jgi:hypothetical protein
MHTERDTARIVRSWLEEGRTALPDHILDAVLDQVPATRQRRYSLPAWRFADMNTYAKLAIGVAAIAVVGINLLPGSGTGVGGPTVSPSPSPLPSPSPSPSPSPGAEVWPLRTLEAGRHEAVMNGISFSFAVPTEGWSSYRIRGMIEKGSYPGPDYRWIGLDMGSADSVATDPCAGLARSVGPSVNDLATAMATIPGTQASEPAETTVGGLPARMVKLTIDAGIACTPRSFWLFGKDSIFPNTLESVIKEWILEVDGKRVVIHSDQAAPDPEIEREIQQIVDSIQFE